MMRTRYFTFIILVSLTLWSCATSTNTDDKTTKQNRISQLEDQLFKDKKGIADEQAAADMIDAYQDYANMFPKDSLSPHYLFRAADISLNIFHSDATIRLFDKIMQDYPNFEGVAHLLFFKAFAYDYYLNNKKEAAIYYNKFLAEYPNHPFAKDAKISLQQLDKTPEEVLESFKK